MQRACLVASLGHVVSFLLSVLILPQETIEVIHTVESLNIHVGDISVFTGPACAPSNAASATQVTAQIWVVPWWMLFNIFI